MNKKRVGITIEARANSTRLPQKILKPILGRPMLAHIIDRLKKVTRADTIVLATTDQPEDDPVFELAKKEGIHCYRGSSEDVLDRVLQAAKKYDIDIIVETCGDCPVIDSRILDQQIQAFLNNNIDYVGCHLVQTFPYGLDAKVFRTETLEEVAGLTSDPADRENVSLYIYEHPERYRLLNIEAEGRCRRPDLRLVVDYEEDFILVEHLYKELYYKDSNFSYEDILDLFESRPDLGQINQNMMNIKVAGRTTDESL